MKNLPSGFGIKSVMSARERRARTRPWKVKTQERGPPRKEHMVDILLFAMVIASAVSLVEVSPRQAQQETIRALREPDGTIPLHACGPNEASKKMERRAQSR
jgi:hypothetical protein